MTIASTPQVAHLRSQLTLLSSSAETALDRAFDLQQAGASSERVDAALAEAARLQEMAREVREQLPPPTTLH